MITSPLLRSSFLVLLLFLYLLRGGISRNMVTTSFFFFLQKMQFRSYHWYIVLHLFSVSIAFSNSDIVIIVVLPVSPAFLLYFTNLRPFESCCMLTKAKPESARTKAEIQLFKYKSFTRSNFYYKTS